MDLRKQRVLQSARRVQSWCAANPGLVPPPEGLPSSWEPLTRLLDVLNTIVTALTEAAAQQEVQATLATLEASDELSLRKHLRAEMHAVTQVAQALRKTVPGISVLRMPATNMQAEALLRAADALSVQASMYESSLVEHGLPADFLAQLGGAMSALRMSIDARGAARAGRVSATKQVSVNTARGHQYVVFLDAALTKVLRTDPAKLAEWKNTKRVTIKGVPHPDIAEPAESNDSLTVTTPTLVTDSVDVTTSTTPSDSVPIIETSERDVHAA
jgi:hypothetical protein